MQGGEGWLNGYRGGDEMMLDAILHPSQVYYDLSADVSIAIKGLGSGRKRE